MKVFIHVIIIFNSLFYIKATESYDDYKYDHKYPFAPYEFGYDIMDEYGNKNWRREEAQSADHVVGSYGFEDVNGIMRQVDYVADKNGFRAKIKTNEPGTSSNNPADVHIDSNPIKVQEHNSKYKLTHSSSQQINSYHPEKDHDFNSDKNQEIFITTT